MQFNQTFISVDYFYQQQSFYMHQKQRSSPVKAIHYTSFILKQLLLLIHKQHTIVIILKV